MISITTLAQRIRFLEQSGEPGINYVVLRSSDFRDAAELNAERDRLMAVPGNRVVVFDVVDACQIGEKTEPVIQWKGDLPGE
jgi:hypothetical protein